MLVRRLERDGLHRRVGGLLKDVREGGSDAFRQARAYKARLAEARALVRQNLDSFPDSVEVLARIDRGEAELRHAFRAACESLEGPS